MNFWLKQFYRFQPANRKAPTQGETFQQHNKRACREAYSIKTTKNLLNKIPRFECLKTIFYCSTCAVFPHK